MTNRYQYAVILNVLAKWYSLSVALPGSILNNAQSPEFKTYVAGEVMKKALGFDWFIVKIARSCAIFCVDEVIIFDETARMTDRCILFTHWYYSSRVLQSAKSLLQWCVVCI